MWRPALGELERYPDLLVATIGLPGTPPASRPSWRCATRLECRFPPSSSPATPAAQPCMRAPPVLPAVEARDPRRSRGRLPRAPRTGYGIARCVRSSSQRFRCTSDLGNAGVRRRTAAVVAVFATPTDGPPGRGFWSRTSQWHARPPRRSRIERATPRLQRAFANPGNNCRRTMRLQRSAHSTAGGGIKWRPCARTARGWRGEDSFSAGPSQATLVSISEIFR